MSTVFVKLLKLLVRLRVHILKAQPFVPSIISLFCDFKSDFALRLNEYFRFNPLLITAAYITTRVIETMKKSDRKQEVAFQPIQLLQARKSVSCFVSLLTDGSDKWLNENIMDE